MKVGQSNLIKTNCFPVNAGNDHRFAGLSSVVNTAVARSCHLGRTEWGQEATVHEMSVAILSVFLHSVQKEQDGSYYKWK